MTLHLHDTATRSARDFVPARPGRASIYLCGPPSRRRRTSGTCVSGVNFDILRRWLVHSGYDVTFVRNVTDIDDKILHQGGRRRACRGGRWPTATSAPSPAAYDTLGCLPPTYEPRATGHVPEMIVLMQRLIDGGHAYAARRRRLLRRRAPAGPTARCRASASTRCRPPATPPATTASATRATSRCGRAPSRASRRGRPRGAPAGPAGTWSARRWPRSTSARPSTSTAAASTSSSRTTRTSSRSPRPPVTSFAAVLDAQRPGSPSAARR